MLALHSCRLVAAWCITSKQGGRGGFNGNTKQGEYLRKGSSVHIEGKNRTRSFDDKQGVKRYVTEIIAEQLILLDKKE